MSLSPGAKLGVHEIVALIGAGGMGEVYRAIDTRLNRPVAIKILPEAYASDTERVARFHREAQAIAALNHTSIAGIYDLADASGVTYLVLELIEGDTLDERLRRGPLPAEEALQIARQILEALETAHEKGICHRDLKPANIKLTSEGVVKVLDFGLAKFLQTPSTPANLTHSPTLSLAGTLPGMILGTAAYMSPEQAKGFEADQRSDIFSFGCILYELLTGRQAFEGETASEILASVLKSEVDLTRLPSRLNPRLIELLRRCLEKNPKKRWHAAADVRVELDAIVAAGIVTTPQAAVPSSRPLRQRVAALLAAALAGGAIAGFAAWRLKPVPAQGVSRFSVTLPGQVFTNAGRRILDISPDGSRIAYVANNSVCVRELAALQPRVLAASDSGASLSTPTFSPDGQSIAYLAVTAAGTVLVRRVGISGGPSSTLSEFPASAGASTGLRWDEHGLVLGLGATGIVRMSADDGRSETIVTPIDKEMLGNAQLLPGAGAILFGSKPELAGWDRAQLVAQRLPNGERKVIGPGSDPRYLPSGHLLYAVSGVLFAVRFNAETLTTVGSPAPLIEGVRHSLVSAASGSGHFAVAPNGTLVYVPGAVNVTSEGTDLALFDRNGRNEPLKLPRDLYRSPRVSRDGRFVAVETGDDKQSAIWVYELGGATAIRRLTFDGRNSAPTWSPDGQWIAFQSDREGDLAIYRQRADGSGAPERLSRPDRDVEHIPQDWARDGGHLLITVRGSEYTLVTLDLKTRRITPFGDARSSALINAVFSPDGKWVAYQTRDGATNRVFVAPFPATGAKYLVPVSGGHPIWSAKNEIVLNTAPSQSASVRVTLTPSLGFAPPQEFPRNSRTEPNPSIARRAADFMPDGERLLGVLVTGASAATSANEFVVVLNWLDELRQRLPAR